MFQDRKWCFCPLKTINAYRSVNITDSFCNYLKKLKSEQDESRKLYGDGYKRNFVTDRLERNKENLMEIADFVNVKINGEMLSTNSIKFMSRIFKEELHIDFKFHNLRHPYVKLKLKLSSVYFRRIFSTKILDFPLYFKSVVGINAHLFDKHICECLC